MGRVLFQVLDQVVGSPNLERKGINRGSNTKPQLRWTLGRNWTTTPRCGFDKPRSGSISSIHPPRQLPRESASVLIQPARVLGFVLEHLAAFNAPKMRGYLKDGDLDSGLYAARFRADTWAGVLKIVRWHVSDCRPEWLPVGGSDEKPPEAAPSTQATDLTDAFCGYAAILVPKDERLHSKLQSSAFRTDLLALLLRHCGGQPDGEEMQLDDGAWGSKGSHADDDGGPCD